MDVFRRSRRHWRWVRCRPVVLLLDTLLSLQVASTYIHTLIK